MSEVVSVRVPKEVKKILDEAGIDVASRTREYLEELAWETRAKQTLAELHGMIEKNVKPSAKGSSAKLIREDRNAHN